MVRSDKEIGSQDPQRSTTISVPARAPSVFSLSRRRARFLAQNLLPFMTFAFLGFLQSTPRRPSMEKVTVPVVALPGAMAAGA